jgi:hypothetical protein
VVNFINFAQFRYYITDIREMSDRNFEGGGGGGVSYIMPLFLVVFAYALTLIASFHIPVFNMSASRT